MPLVRPSIVDTPNIKNWKTIAGHILTLITTSWTPTTWQKFGTSLRECLMQVINAVEVCQKFLTTAPPGSSSSDIRLRKNKLLHAIPVLEKLLLCVKPGAAPVPPALLKSNVMEAVNIIQSDIAGPHCLSEFDKFKPDAILDTPMAPSRNPKRTKRGSSSES